MLFNLGRMDRHWTIPALASKGDIRSRLSNVLDTGRGGDGLYGLLRAVTGLFFKGELFMRRLKTLYQATGC